MPNNFKLTITKEAETKIKDVLTLKSIETFFRIEISSGGCAGFSISFTLDTNISEDDLVIKENGITIVINKMIADFIKEAELKYSKDILSSYFTLDVKTAAEKCSCGKSFGI